MKLSERSDSWGDTMSSTRFHPNPARDWSCRQGAEALAADIIGFWATFGFTILAWVEPVRGADGKDAIWTVKTSLQAGLPPVT
jgi:hypothetical protein